MLSPCISPALLLIAATLLKLHHNNNDHPLAGITTTTTTTTTTTHTIQKRRSRKALHIVIIHPASTPPKPTNMPVPEYGAAPLAKTFVLVRGLSLICMIAIVGMTANFVAEIIGSSVEPPKEIVGTLVVVRGTLSRSPSLSPSPSPSHSHTHRKFRFNSSPLTFQLPDMPSRTLLPHQHPLLLRPSQPRSPNHDRHGFLPPPRLHRRRGRHGQTSLVPKLFRCSRLERCGERSFHRGFHSSSHGKFWKIRQYFGSGRLGWSYQGELLRDEIYLGILY